MDSLRQQIVDSINANTNILVTVSANPTVDELSAALGLTILLNNMEKRATAVFSGTIPPAITFLEPDKTFESTADSLRDFIIALDKEKADHLRYKVDGDVVKIFITPYRTTLSQKDLEFSQGDYNVELVIAVGVKDQDHLDKALAAHGKILHDAVVVTVTAGAEASNLGTIDWHDAMASSLSEMMIGLVDALKTETPLLDEQISTAFLTGIVSATDRFSNDRTSSRVMTMAAQLMAAGANQQLIAAKLAEAHDIGPGPVIGKNGSKPVEQTTEPQPEPAEKQSRNDELSIDRPGKKSKKPKQRDDAASQTSEEQGQVPGEKELEAQIAGAAPVVEQSLVDIEQALQAATDQLSDEPADQPAPVVESTPEPELAPQEPLQQEPIATTDDLPQQPAADEQQAPFAPSQFAPAPPQPGLAPIPEPVAEQAPLFEPPLPALPPLPESPFASQGPSNQIINDHGTFSDQPPSNSQPINSINAGPVVGETSINPFAAPINPTVNDTSSPGSQQETSFEPVPAPVIPVDSPQQGGTPEGAAQLGAMPSFEPLQQPLPQSAPEPVAPEIPTLPELPPLPPLPADGSLPPLPPPPPLPNFGQSAPMPSGAVSGDIFGDSASTPAPAPAPAPEPGQFRIPGQG